MSPSTALRDLLDRITCGAVLLDDEGRVAGFNDAAEGHLRELCANIKRCGFRESHVRENWTPGTG